MVNIATRSGTNDFHGEVFEFYRNEALDARNYFNVDTSTPPQPQSKFNRHQFGANLGGPILENRTHFFASYEGLRQRQALDFNSGVLSRWPNARRSPIPWSATCSPSSRSRTRWAPRGEARFLGTGSADVDIDQCTGDVNHTFGDNDRFHGYYAYQRDKRAEPNLQGNTIPEFGDTRTSSRQILTLNQTHIFWPKPGERGTAGLQPHQHHLHAQRATESGRLRDQQRNQPGCGLPADHRAGLGLNFGGPAGFPQGRVDTTSWSPTRSATCAAGTPSSSGANTGASTTTTSRPTAARSPFRAWPTSRPASGSAFTVTLGEIASDDHPAGLRLLRAGQLQGALERDPGARLPVRPQRLAHRGRRPLRVLRPRHRVAVPRGGGQPRQDLREPHNFQPRVGVVWDPWNDGRTSIRAAYARLSDQPVTNLVTPTAGNPPW